MESARILIVEDDASLVSYLKTILKDFGYTVAAAVSSGEEAIEKAALLKPDVILMDILLPGNIDGVAAAQQINSKLHIPVIYVTAYADESTIQRAIISQPSGYIVKPFQENELNVAVQLALASKKAVTVQRPTEKSFDLFFGPLPQAVLISDETGTVRFLNLAAQNLTGWSAEDVIDKPFDQVFQTVDQQQPLAVDDSIVYRSGSNEALLRTKSGTEIPIDYTSSILAEEKQTWYVTVFRSIAENKRLEDALNESRKKYKGLVNSIDGIVWEADVLTGRYIFVSRQTEKILGYPPSIWITEQDFWRNHIYPADRASALVMRATAISQKKDYATEYRMIAADGSVKWVRELVTFFAESNGTLKLVGVTIDATQKRLAEEEIRLAKEQLEIRVRERTAELTKAYQKMVFELNERKKAESALRKSESKYRKLFEESEEMIFISAPQGHFLDINPAGVRLLGYDSREDLLAPSGASEVYWNPEDRKEFMRLMEEQGHVKDWELHLRRKDGKKLILLETSSAVRNDKGEIIAYRGIIRDVTKIKELEEQLRHAQKMEAIGHLAGGLAHDFNNILMAIMGYCELLQMKTEGSDSVRNDLAEIQRAAEAGGALIRQLLAFSRKQVLETRVLDLNKSILDMENLLQRLIGSHIMLVIHTGEPAWVKADPVQIEQVLMNLATNARDAMPQGGTLSIDSTNTVVEPGGAIQPPPGRYAMLSVKDDGIGMDDATVSRVFEPFFTTKEKGKGTGLGLATVYGIVKQSGGHIDVESSVGRGTTFRIYLPLIERAESTTIAEKTSRAVSNGGQTILIVDDNELARKPFALQLEMHGYRVLEANSGEEALRLSRAHAGAIDLLITDLVMPGIGGRELFRSIRVERPDLKTLFMSGYDEKLLSGERLEQGTAFVAKPTTGEVLMQKIRDLL